MTTFPIPPDSTQVTVSFSQPEVSLPAAGPRRPLPRPPDGAHYRHRLGGVYRILSGSASHSETREALVVFQAAFGSGHVIVIPLASFLSVNERGEPLFVPTFPCVGAVLQSHQLEETGAGDHFDSYRAADLPGFRFYVFDEGGRWEQHATSPGGGGPEDAAASGPDIDGPLAHLGALRALLRQSADRYLAGVRAALRAGGEDRP